ncbi:actin-like ATPase domain-containing protein [Aspergillus sclerotioniger CBS 115572]|uniref:Phosphotransferase n=1 Tax=Aspergillus sclerotioniger CBS 115572 TaxID=1450535 RepID=A0A317W7J1_9EURO|nr:actin-like ATPase domain-containing protein [Aspergillus sclerotioniger CBS 115572]PWY81641.1 actin-like ATPase domain-containing protein [Aspergillus sclerotioniger CBS 115572]
MLQEAIDRLGLPVVVTVLANDGVGTLLTRSYTSGPTASTLAAVIFGTGTNAAYVEKLSNVSRFSGESKPDEIMVVNTEWGCFDDQMEVLPRTSFDDELDEASADPGIQMLEKRVSGLYLGELLRLVIFKLIRENAFAMTCNHASGVFQRDGIDSSFLSELAKASSDNTENIIQLIQNTLSAENVSEVDARAIQLLATAIGRRAARLAGASLAAIVIQSGRLEMPAVQASGAEYSMHHSERFKSGATLLWRRLLRLTGMGSSVEKPSAPIPSRGSKLDKIIDIGADGSLIEYYPSFETDMRGALRDVPEVGPAGEQRVQISMAKDGSGVGAALMAQAASEMDAGL